MTTFKKLFSLSFAIIITLTSTLASARPANHHRAQQETREAEPAPAN